MRRCQTGRLRPAETILPHRLNAEAGDRIPPQLAGLHIQIEITSSCRPFCARGLTALASVRPNEPRYPPRPEQELVSMGAMPPELAVPTIEAEPQLPRTLPRRSSNRIPGSTAYDHSSQDVRLPHRVLRRSSRVDAPSRGVRRQARAAGDKDTRVDHSRAPFAHRTASGGVLGRKSVSWTMRSSSSEERRRLPRRTKESWLTFVIQTDYQSYSESTAPQDIDSEAPEFLRSCAATQSHKVYTLGVEALITTRQG